MIGISYDSGRSFSAAPMQLLAAGGTRLVAAAKNIAEPRGVKRPSLDYFSQQDDDENLTSTSKKLKLRS